MKFGRIIAIATCLVLALGVIGCSPNYAKNFEGTWAVESINTPDQNISAQGIAFLEAFGLQVTLDLKNDGTAVFTAQDQTKEGTWKATSATEALVTFDGNETTLVLEEDLLTMSKDGSSFTFKRGSANTGGTATSNQEPSSAETSNADSNAKSSSNGAQEDVSSKDAAVSSSSAQEDASASQTAASSNEQASNDKQELVIKDAGYVLSNGYIMYAVAIENLSTTKAAQFPEVYVTGKTADGAIAFNDTWTVGTLEPGSTTYWANQAGNGNVTAEDVIEFDIATSERNWIKPSGNNTNELYTIENTTITVGDFGMISATGEITLNAESKDTMHRANSPMVVAILKNADGKIVGGFNGYIMSDLTVGKKMPFEISGHFDMPEYETCEFYANPW